MSTKTDQTSEKGAPNTRTPTVATSSPASTSSSAASSSTTNNDIYDSDITNQYLEEINKLTEANKKALEEYEAKQKEMQEQLQYTTDNYNEAKKTFDESKTKYDDAKSKYDELAAQYTGAAGLTLANAQGTQTAARAGRQASKSAMAAARSSGMSKAQSALGGMAAASDAASSNYQNGVDTALKTNESAMNYGLNSVTSAQNFLNSALQLLQLGSQRDLNVYNALKDKYSQSKDLYDQAYAKYRDDLNRWLQEKNSSAERKLQRDQFEYQKSNDNKSRWSNLGNSIAQIATAAIVGKMMSDEDLKTVYPNMSDDMLAKFAKIRSYEYKYTPEAQEAQEKTGDFPGVDNEPHTGILAQEVEKAIPNAVTENPEGFKMIKENELTNANTGAIGELSRRVLSLEDMLKEVTGYIKANGVNYIDSNNYLNGENNGTK